MLSEFGIDLEKEATGFELIFLLMVGIVSLVTTVVLLLLSGAFPLLHEVIIANKKMTAYFIFLIAKLDWLAINKKEKCV